MVAVSGGDVYVLNTTYVLWTFLKPLQEKIFDRWCYFTVIDRTRWWSERGSSNRGPHHCCSDQWEWAVSGDGRREQDMLSRLLLWRIISGERNLDHPHLYSICIPLGVRYRTVSCDECGILLRTNVDSIAWSRSTQLTNIIPPLLSVTKAPLSSPNSTWHWSEKNKEMADWERSSQRTRCGQQSTGSSNYHCCSRDCLIDAVNFHRFHLLVM